MASSITQEWRAFRSDPPGERFHKHHERMRQRSRTGAIVRLTIGVILVLAGIVMLFVPGPGLLVMLFGLGLFAGESKKLADLLDRAEPRARRIGRAVEGWWHARSMVAQDVMIAGCVVLLGGCCYGAWAWWVS